MVTKILAIFSLIKFIPDVIKKTWNIFRGWYYKLFGKKQDLADRRLAICNKCEYKINTSLGEACSQCGCILDAKTRVDDEVCDMNKW